MNSICKETQIILINSFAKSFPSPEITNQNISRNSERQNNSEKTNLGSNFTVAVDRTNQDVNRIPLAERDDSVEAPNGLGTINSNDSTSTNVNETNNQLNLFLNYNE
ncbi:unnamed protein product [[Candida] boidinii]|nr:unnamed protein product [[Candida] boidinii]